MTWLRRPRNAVLALVVLMVLAGIGAAFHPGLQTRVIGEQLAKRLDTFEIERIHVLPWSLSMTGLRFTQDGQNVEIGSARVDFSLWRLAFDVVALNTVEITDAEIDLRNVPPATEEAKPFPGLFAVLDRGFGLSVDSLRAAGRVRIDEQHAIRFRAGGGEFAPEATGTLDIDVVARRTDDDTRVEIAGQVMLAQGEAGSFVSLVADLLVTASSPALREDELVEVVANLEPIEVPRVGDDGEPAGTEITGDRFRVVVSRPGPGGDLASLILAGTHDAPTRTVSGDHEIVLHDGLVKHYAPQAVLPDFVERARGQFHVDLVSGSAAVDLRGEARIENLETVLGTNEALPRTLELGHTFSTFVDARRLEIHELDLRLVGNAAEPLLTVALAEAVAIPFAEPRAALGENRAFGTIAIRDVPVSWLNGLLPEALLRDGRLAGEFEMKASDGAFVLAPAGAFGIEAATFDERYAIPEALHLRAGPSARYDGDDVTLRLDDLRLMLGERLLASLDVVAGLKLGGDDAPDPSVQVTASVDLNGIAELPLIAERLENHPLPEGLSASFDARLNANAERVRIHSLTASVRQREAPPLIRAEALQPFSIALGAGNVEFVNPDGELAVLVVDDIDLAWIDPLVPGIELAGSFAAGTFTMSAGPDNALAVRTRDPLRLDGVLVRRGDDVLVEDLDLRLRPEVDYSATRVDLRYAQLEARLGDARLLAADGGVSAPLGDDSPAGIDAVGRLDVDLVRLRRLPVLAATLEGVPARRKWQLSLEYDLSGDAERIDLSALRAAIAVDGEARVRLENEAALVLRPVLEKDEDLAQHLVGVISADLNGLTSELLTDLLPLGNLGFDDLSVQATVRSDGSVLTADTVTPLTVTGVRVNGEAGPLLNPLTVSASANVRIVDQTVDATLETVSVAFDRYKERPAVSGAMSFTLEPPHAIPLRSMQAKLTGFLPALLDQPVILPRHHLRAGGFTLDVVVRDDGSIESNSVLDGLEASEPLAIREIRATANGAVAADGRGFGFSMPVTGVGRSGETDGMLTASYNPAGAEKALLNLEFSSERFLLNDVLAALASIRGEKAAAVRDAAAPGGQTAPVSPDTTPDERAFWDVLPYDTRVDYRIRDLYYTDYVILNDVGGEIRMTSDNFTLASLAARFHDSPMKFDGTLAFDKSVPRPYDLELEGKISDFDLNQFFTELVPGTKPRVEGLFSVDIDGYGASPNMAQFRNELLFDMKMKSREGVFRPLPPDGALMSGASDLLGIVGEGLSYVPTGGFGAGAVSRLVNYISVIDYDRIDINVVRDETRDIVIRQFLVQSPTISLTAQGGIDYVDGKDILDSPLTLDAHLNMSGKGAAILYSMNLLDDEKDAFGYYQGPAFRIRGTPSDAQSNFADIVTAAADGTVKGGITRPISGLIGNIKHRWFGDEPKPYRDEAAEPATP